MKTIMTTLLSCLLLGSSVSAQQDTTKKADCENDSTRMHFKGLEIIVVEKNPCNTSEDTTGRTAKEKRESKKAEKFSSWGGVYLGVSGYMTPSGSTTLEARHRFLELNYSKCITFGLNFPEIKFKIVPKYVGLTTGLGIQWNKYGFKNNYTLTYNADSVYGVRDTAFTFSKNKLTATYLHIPLLFEFRTNAKASKAFHMGLGVIGAFKIGSRLKQEYEAGGFESEGRIKGHYQLNPFQLYATVRMGFGNRFNIFFNYCLDGLFEPGKGPDLRPFTAGIYLPFD